MLWKVLENKSFPEKPKPQKTEVITRIVASYSFFDKKWPSWIISNTVPTFWKVGRLAGWQFELKKGALLNLSGKHRKGISIYLIYP